MKKLVAALIVAVVALGVLQWRASASTNNQYQDTTTTSRSEQVVTVVTQKRIIPTDCMHLTDGVLQVRKKAIIDDVATPFTDWQTVRIIEYYENPYYPECAG